MGGFVLFYVVLLLSWLVPPFLIFRSQALTGWNKVRWVVGCLMSAVLPLVLPALALALAVRVADYQLDARALMFGPEALLIGVANMASLVLPWLVYLGFKKRNARRP